MKKLRFILMWLITLLVLANNWSRPVFAQQPTRGSRISIVTPSEKLVRSFESIVIQTDTSIADAKRVELFLSRVGYGKQISEFWDGKEWKLGSALNSKQLAQLDQGKWIFNTLGAFASTDSYRYSLEVNAISENGRSSHATRTFSIDWSPKLTIDFSQQGSIVDSVVESKQVKGTVIPSRGREIKFVRVFLSRKTSDGVTEHWNGKAWRNGEPTALAASLLPPVVNNAGVQWVWDQGNPILTQLTDGSYRVEVLAADDEGETSTATTKFTLSRDPAIQIEAPLNGAVLTSALRVSGSLLLPSVVSNSKDEVRIELSQFDFSPDLYWDGRQWVKQQKMLRAVVDSSDQISSRQRWHLKEAPSFSLMPDGRYRVAAFVYRGAEVVSAADAFFEVHRGPITIITTPLAGSTQTIGTRISVVSGTINQGIDNAPIEKVKLALSRLKNNGAGEVWTGSQWEKAPSKATSSPNINRTKDGRFAWSWEKQLPPASSMIAGVYYLTVWSTDSKGRVGATSITFEVRN